MSIPKRLATAVAAISLAGGVVFGAVACEPVGCNARYPHHTVVPCGSHQGGPVQSVVAR